MPWCVLRIKEAKSFGLFQDAAYADMLPDEWFTTVTGLFAARCNQTCLGDAADDGSMLTTLRLYCGTVEGYVEVVYPEQIKPIAKPDEADFDQGYWRLLASRGEACNQIPDQIPDQLMPGSWSGQVSRLVQDTAL
jgi:hypothetical protein